MRYKIVLFQPYLRKHILNFGNYLKKFEYIIRKPTSGNFYKTQLPPSFEQEVRRIKTSRINKIRRLLGLLNFRIKFDQEADMFFTFGCLLLTNKPYCVYIENGIALYNYDIKIAAHPIARLLFSLLIRQNNCKRLIFMNQTSQTSFLSTVPYRKKTLAIIKNKSAVVYPLIEKKSVAPKKFTGKLKLLFVGMFYIKGGTELTQAYAQLRKTYTNIELTIVTPLQTIKTTDYQNMKQIPGLTLIDAALGEKEMNTLYREHDIFLLPTYRDSAPLVLIEAVSWGMPIICTDQYSIPEIAEDNHNAFVYHNHPLKDYDPTTYRPLGKYHNPRDFYYELFRLQKAGELEPIKNFIFNSIERFLKEPFLLEKFSLGSLELYNRKLHQNRIASQIESVFLETIKQ